MNKNLMSFCGVIMFTVFTITSDIALAGQGGTGSGGGYILACPENGRDVYYSYDYKLTESHQAEVDVELNRQNDVKEVLKIIQRNLAKKLPKMAESLLDFLSFNENEFDSRQDRLWTYGRETHRLINLHDEAKLREIKECRPQAIQAIIRSQPKNQIIYDVDLLSKNRLESSSINPKRNPAIQLSFLYVHEWLRDFTQDSIVIARVTRMLHSAGAQSASESELHATLVNRGLKPEVIGPTTGMLEYQQCRLVNGALLLEIRKLEGERSDMARQNIASYAGASSSYSAENEMSYQERRRKLNAEIERLTVLEAVHDCR